MQFDDTLYSMTTIIEIECGSFRVSGSGFFYNLLSEKDIEKGSQWREIEGMWLVTNRHVALPKINETEMIPDIFTFNFRQKINGKIEWFPVSLKKDEYIKRLRLHNDSNVDIALIEIADLYLKLLLDKEPIMSVVGLTSDNLPSNTKSPLYTGSDVLVAGYPRGYYDRENKFPIVKAGIISTKWGDRFQGNPCFLIDAKLFPGSSGSVVITKPQQMALIDGKLMTNQNGEFVFLGVYSGEPIEQKRLHFEDMEIIKNESYNVGYVWYSCLIPQIIKEGIAITQ